MKAEQNLDQVSQGIVVLSGGAGSSVGESRISVTGNQLVMGSEIGLQWRVGSETWGATGPGGLESGAKDFQLCPVDFGEAL